MLASPDFAPAIRPDCDSVGPTFARGGLATAKNLELRCRGHNGYEATLFFGEVPRAREGEPASAW